MKVRSVSIIMAVSLILAVALPACDTFLLPETTPTPAAQSQATPLASSVTPLSVTPIPSPTQMPVTPTVVPTVTPTTLPAGVWLGPLDVRVHPDGGLYSGDQVSFQITAHAGKLEVRDLPVTVTLPNGQQPQASIGFIAAGSTGEARLDWAWNTTGVSGTVPLTITIGAPRSQNGPRSPLNLLPLPGTTTTAAQTSTVVTLTIQPASALPSGERGARWLTRESDCCKFHYVSGTAAERDIAQIMSTADAAVAYDQDQFGEKLRGKLDIYLISRVLGQGGFAGDWVAISYLDRNYAPGELTQLFRHETMHVLHHQFAGGFTTLVAEGTAVWMAGGHYKPEPIDERAAALLQRGGYIPLKELANDFYSHQHEIGYLEAGSLMRYLVQRNGLDQFKQFLRAVGKQRGDNADALDKALRQTYSVGLDAMEREWLDSLRRLAPNVSPGVRQDLDATLAFYDTMRRYEQAYDSSAYFRTLWSPDLRRAESQGIIADVVRHPSAGENVALETMLIAASDAQESGDAAGAQNLLASVNTVLDEDGSFRDPVSAEYLAVVRAARAAGHDPQRITLSAQGATVVSLAPNGQLTSTTFTRTASGWQAQ